MLKKIFLFNVALFLYWHVSAQNNIHPQSTEYTWPEDKAVRDKLDKWQDQKFGMIVHWGLYAVPGIIESWALCSEDWIERDSTIAYDDFKKWYWGLSKTFNPAKFNPSQWAEAGKKAGMKYLVFTTKHHDGFCMFDTKQTDFSIASGPFKTNKQADVAKYVFEAFRKNDFMIGAYFSKPDWHSPYYWWPKYATADRNNNYDIRKYPWRWEQYKNFTHNQINELMTNYGSIDILWLDGGWVRPRETVNDEVRSWGARIPEWSQDIDMPAIAAMGRKAQPGLLIVDRTVHGPYENYQTPEQKVPDGRLDHPWESCMTLGNNWGYTPGDKLKSPAKIIHTLIEVAAKGGSLLLGVGPKPDGLLHDDVIKALEEIGKWTTVNGAAIYGTRSVENFRDSNIYFTKSKSSDKFYALVCLDDSKPVPASVTWKNHFPKNKSEMILLQGNKKLKWKQEGDSVRVFIPSFLAKSISGNPALAISFEAAGSPE